MGHAHFGKLLRIRHRQRAEPHSIQQLENGSIRADAETQREDGDYGKRRILAELTASVDEVLQHVLTSVTVFMR